MQNDPPIKFPKVDNMQSIFTSEFFTAFVDQILPTLDQRASFLTVGAGGLLRAATPSEVATKFNGTNGDLLNFVNKFGGFLAAETCNLDTGIGYDDEGNDLIANVDPINYEIAHGVYRLRQHRRDAKFYFMTPALAEALDHTDLKWVDLQSFADLPAVLGLRLGGFKMKVNSEIHVCDDLLLIRDDTDATRRKALKDHAVAPESQDTAMVFHWLTQSRDELHLGLQSQTFGTFVLHKDMKLDDILTTLDEWSKRETDRVREEAYSGGLLDRVTEARETMEADLHADPHEAHMVREHSRFLENTLKQESWDEDQRVWYSDILRFMFKFVLLLSAEGVRVKPLLPPGVKDKANPSRKAKKVHEALWKSWGRRYLVDVPKEYHPLDADRKSPTRHIVKGHFKTQPYGPGNSLRKIIWRVPFWRGEVALS